METDGYVAKPNAPARDEAPRRRRARAVAGAGGVRRMRRGPAEAIFAIDQKSSAIDDLGHLGIMHLYSNFQL